MLQEIKKIFTEVIQSVLPIIAVISVLLIVLKMPISLVFQFRRCAPVYPGSFLFLIGIR